MCISVIFLSCELPKSTALKKITLPKSSKELILQITKQNKIPQEALIKTQVVVHQNNQEITLTLNMKIKRDSVVWASLLGPFNLELFRLLIRKDSVFYMDKMNKAWSKKPLQHITEYLQKDFSFYDVQNIIFGAQDLTEKKYNFYENDTCFSLISKNKNQTEKYFINKETYKVALVEFLEENNLSKDPQKTRNKFSYRYLGYSNKEKYLFPKGIRIILDANIKSTQESFLTTIKYLKISLKNSQDYSFNIPKSYVQDQ